MTIIGISQQLKQQLNEYSNKTESPQNENRILLLIMWGAIHMHVQWVQRGMSALLPKSILFKTNISQGLDHILASLFCIVTLLHTCKSSQKLAGFCIVTILHANQHKNQQSVGINSSTDKGKRSKAFFVAFLPFVFSCQAMVRKTQIFWGLLQGS